MTDRSCETLMSSTLKSIVILSALVVVGVAAIFVWQGTRSPRSPINRNADANSLSPEERDAGGPRRPMAGNQSSDPARKENSNSPPATSSGTGAGLRADIAGFWEGNLQVQAATLRLVLNVKPGDDGGYTATIDSVDQGAKDIPVNSITLSNRQLRVELSALAAVYQAELNANATELSGQWRQGPGSFPLNMVRTTKPSTVAAALPTSAYARRQDAPLQGWWTGTIKAGGTPLRVVFKIALQSPGAYRATLESPDQGAKNIPVNRVEFNPPELSMDIDAIGGRFEGAFATDASGIDGNWMQRGANFQLQLKRIEPAEEAPLPASAFTFTRETELQGIWNGSLDLNGNKLRLVLKLAKLSEGNYRATLDSPDQGGRDIPASSVKVTNTDLEVEWKALAALYHGQLESGKLVGFWQQGPSEFPLDLERTNRVGTAVKPANP